MTGQRFTLGQRVRFRPGDRLRRKWEPDLERGGPGSKRWASAREMKWDFLVRGGWREGIVVGTRTYTNGHLGVGEYAFEAYTVTETIPVVLIATGLRTAPVAVRPEHVEVLP